jgi:serine/threonine protein kinase
MGEVYRARDVRVDRTVALKVLPEDFLEGEERQERFRREARLLASLNHPGIATLYSFEEIPGSSSSSSSSSLSRHVLVMELVEGEGLDERLAFGALAPEDALSYALQIAEALEAAHEKGIVHRDLKPANVRIASGGRTKLLDFGLARRQSVRTDDDLATLSMRTDPGTVLGTAAYMAPEQARGLPADHRSDLFSLGAILFEMLTGRRAFSGRSAAEVLASVLRDAPRPPPPASGLAGALSEVARRCLEKDPARRFSSARDVAAALKAAASAVSRAPASSSAPRVADVPASIAVLPFRNLAADKDAEYLSDGLSEEIIHALAKVEALHVAARTSSFAFKDKAEDVRSIGERLGVRTVLEGSVRQAGGRLRVTAQLIDVSTGYQLWSERFDRTLDDVFAVQDEIARAIAGTLRVRLFGDDSGSRVAAPRDPAAYDLYLRGRFFFNRRSARHAIEAFDEALARDPAFAAAYTGLADAWGIHGFYGGIDTRIAFARGRAAVEQARALAPDAPEVAISTAIQEHYFGWDFAHEVRVLTGAAAAAPRLAAPYYWHGLTFGLRGLVEEARPLLERVEALEPFNPLSQTAVGWTYLSARRFEEARSAFARALEMDPHAVLPLNGMGRALVRLGEPAAALGVFERLVGVLGKGSSFAVGGWAHGLAAAGRANEARAALDALGASGVYVPATHVVDAEFALGDGAAALASLARAVEERNALAWWWVRHEPGLAPLRDDPGFPAIESRIVPAA